MDIWQAMQERHSVRTYLDKPIEQDKVDALQAAIEQCNKESGLHIRLFTEEPEAFAAGKAHYGAFSGCRNYLAMVGDKDKEEAVGYYGERLVLLAQMLGLNTCWVALTFRRGKVQVASEKQEKLHVVIALGYGKAPGVPHKSKPMDKLAEVQAGAPEWFEQGMRAVMLAPTAINQQKFNFRLTPQGKVVADTKWGPCTKIDLGIAKYHFEQGAGKENFEWA